MDITQSIENLAYQIPPLPPLRPKNFFDITGIRNKEVINSRVLGYFLNAKEEHGLERLFFESLMDLIKKKKRELSDIDPDVFAGDFTVEEEEPTINAIEKDDQKKRIDLVLKGAGWAIIIENKLYHDVINPLRTYWDHLKEYKHKIGIVLSLFEVKAEKYKGTGFIFINITHKSLISQIGQNFKFGPEPNEISLFYLKEYFRTIDTHYTAIQNAPQMNEIVNKLIIHREKVNSVLQKMEEANKFIVTQVVDALKKYDFKNINGLANPARLFFTWEAIPSIVIAVNTEKLLTENRLVIHLAILTYEVTPEIIDDLRTLVASRVNILNSANFQAGTYSGKEHTHLLVFTDTNFLQPGENFDSKFKQLLTTELFVDNGVFDQIKTRLN